jgi:2-polyprenyl-3-methyl-5-hydroxy-6-metoxy-1,4-benzoquinol methylase
MNCNLCGSNRQVILFRRASPNTRTRQEFTLVQCMECGLKYIKESRSQEEAKLFGVEFFSGGENAVWNYNYSDYCRHEANHMRVANERLDKIESLSHVGTILDVGCAMGFFLREAERRGWRGYGVDVSEHACQYAKNVMGLNVEAVELKDAGFQGEFFDVITMWSVIEYMKDPLTNLLEAFRTLKNNGLLIIETPDVDSVRYRLFPGDWSWFAPPLRLYYFSKRTLAMMLRRAGFEPVGMNTRGEILQGTVLERLLGRRLTGYLSSAGNALNLGHIIIIYARKLSMRH